MIRILNKLAHFALGAWSGWNFRSPAMPACVGLFIAYQGLEVASKGDSGYGEIREFAIGYGLGLSLRWLTRTNIP